MQQKWPPRPAFPLHPFLSSSSPFFRQSFAARQYFLLFQFEVWMYIFSTCFPEDLGDQAVFFFFFVPLWLKKGSMMRGGASLHWKHLEVTVGVNIFSTKSHVFNWRHLTSVFFSSGWQELESRIVSFFFFLVQREKIETPLPLPSASIINSDALDAPKTRFFFFFVRSCTAELGGATWGRHRSSDLKKSESERREVCSCTNKNEPKCQTQEEKCCECDLGRCHKAFPK